MRPTTIQAMIPKMSSLSLPRSQIRTDRDYTPHLEIAQSAVTSGQFGRMPDPGDGTKSESGDGTATSRQREEELPRPDHCRLALNHYL